MGENYYKIGCFAVFELPDALNYQNTSGNSKTATPALQLNGLSSQEPAPTTIQAKDVIYA